jgi:hypothetical protein
MSFFKKKKRLESEWRAIFWVEMEASSIRRSEDSSVAALVEAVCRVLSSAESCRLNEVLMGNGVTAREANSLAEIGRKERLRSIADGLIFLSFFFFFFCFSGFGSKQWRCI